MWKLSKYATSSSGNPGLLFQNRTVGANNAEKTTKEDGKFLSIENLFFVTLLWTAKVL